MRTLITIWLLWLAPAVLCRAEVPKLQKGVKIEVAGEPIDIEVGHLVPSVADFNGDGNKDLIFGQFKEGRINFCPNTGTDTDPSFEEIIPLKTDGEPISLAAG